MKNTQSDEADLGRFRGDTYWGKVNMKLQKLLQYQLETIQ